MARDEYGRFVMQEIVEEDDDEYDEYDDDEYDDD